MTVKITAADFGLPEYEYCYDYLSSVAQKFLPDDNFIIKDIDWTWQLESDYVTIESVDVPIETNYNGTNGTYTVENVYYSPQVDQIAWGDGSYTIHYENGSVLFVPGDSNGRDNSS